ncbi:MAG: biotin attachment protein, partial [Robiginitalea sp.]
MLNISPNKLNDKVDLSRFTAAQKVFHKRHYKHFNRFLLAFATIGIIVLFLPWTQNISGEGYLTTLHPDQRPQT